MTMLSSIKTLLSKGMGGTSRVPFVPQTDHPLTATQDLRAAAQARESLEEQMIQVIDANADGVNRSALRIRRNTDLLLSLGITDAFAAQAGSLAQLALELANSGRGINLQAEPHHITAVGRAELVSQSMAVVLRAEMMLHSAMKSNRANITAALERQSRLLSNVHVLVSNASE